MYLPVFAIIILAGCGESKKAEVEKKAADELRVEQEKMAEALNKTEDSLRQVRVDSIRRDSILQDSLRQVREHGHVH